MSTEERQRLVAVIREIHRLDLLLWRLERLCGVAPHESGIAIYSAMVARRRQEIQEQADRLSRGLAPYPSVGTGAVSER
jgi:hypothetical protein